MQPLSALHIVLFYLSHQSPVRQADWPHFTDEETLQAQEIHSTQSMQAERG